MGGAQTSWHPDGIGLVDPASRGSATRRRGAPLADRKLAPCAGRTGLADALLSAADAAPLAPDRDGTRTSYGGPGVLQLVGRLPVQLVAGPSAARDRQA